MDYTANPWESKEIEIMSHPWAPRQKIGFGTFHPRGSIPKRFLFLQPNHLDGRRILKNVAMPYFVILSEAKNLVILLSDRSFTSFRMTEKTVFQKPVIPIRSQTYNFFRGESCIRPKLKGKPKVGPSI